MKKRYIIPILLILVYLLGPRASYEKFDGQLSTLEIPLIQLDQFIAEKEAKVVNLKPDNQSRIVWADSIRQTEYAVVYLHGFSASPQEGNPVHREFARRYGANLYIPRLAGHGIQDRDAFEELSPKTLIDSAKEAIAIGRLLGKKIILMSCSTGSTLALYLAAENPEAFHSLLMYSPNIDLYSSSTELMTMPWGQQLTRLLVGEHRTIESFVGTPMEKYWTTTYSTKGLICLKYLIEHTMTEANLKKIKQPYFLAYYYKNEEQFDDVVSIEEMKWFHKISATPADQKKLIAFQEVDSHVMISDLQSKDLDTVRKETFAFAEETLGLEVK